MLWCLPSRRACSVRRAFSLTAVAALLGGAPCALRAASSSRDAGAIYQELCANCHGAKLEGGKGGSLRGDPWKHGGDDESLARSIRDGYPHIGMPGFRATMSEAETQALIAFMRETATRVIDPTPASEGQLPREPLRSQEHAFRIESIAEGLEVPWSMAFLPDGRMLVTERTGRLRMIENGALRPELIGGLPPLVAKHEAGLMSVVPHPKFAENNWVYLSFCDPGGDGTAMTKIVRARLQGWQLVHRQTIFEIPREQYPQGYVLFGGRLVFAGDHLFFSVGVRGLDEAASGTAQDLARPTGKIHRVFADGSIPPDNPFVGTRGAIGSIWALGVRNPQGLAVDPRDGVLWETEHGPRGGDELNRIERGKNYGWPLVTAGINYDGTPITDRKSAPGFESPVVDWTPSIAVSELEFYTGDAFARWKNQALVGSLATQKLIRLVISDGRVTHYEELFKNLGRIRDIKTGPDGLIYLAIENIGKPGRVVRLVPADSSVNGENKLTAEQTDDQ